jgi:predicted AAA+ superfamily ATPase
MTKLPILEFRFAAEQLMARIEAVLPQPLGAPDWGASIAWRYRKRSSGHGVLEPVRHVGAMQLST